MPWCPNCKEEYRDGFTVCIECGAELVDELALDSKETKRVMQGKTVRKIASRDNTYSFEMAELRKEPLEEVFLVNVSDTVQLAYITSMLKENGIEHRVIEEDIGQYMSFIFGRSFVGKSLFVAKEDYDEAALIVKSFKAEDNDVVDKELVRLSQSTSVSKGVIWKYLKFGALGILAALVLIILWLIGVV